MTEILPAACAKTAVSQPRTRGFVVAHTSHSMGFAFSAVVYASGYIFLMFVAVCLGARRAASSVTIVESEVLP